MSKKIVIEFENFGEEEYKHIKNAFNQFASADVSTEKVLSFGELQIDPIRRTVMRKDQKIPLTATEFDILFYLASHPEFVFTHRQIYEAIWKKDYFRDEGNVTAHIGRIRKKIEPDSQRPIYIQTVRGVGYKFAKQEAGNSI